MELTKVYVVKFFETPVFVSLEKIKAHEWAAANYDSDDTISVESYYLQTLDSK